MEQTTIQKRTVELAVTGLQAREVGEDKKRIIEGYALKYNTRSVDLMAWSSQYAMFEVLHPGCITMEMLKEQDIKFTCFHNREKIIGRWNKGEGSLNLILDEVGMKVICEMPGTELGKEMYELVSRGDLSGMSFVYSTNESDSENCVSMEYMDGEEYNGKEVYIRNVKCIKRMYDVTIAADPAYKDTEVSAKEREAIEGAIETQRKNSSENAHETVADDGVKNESTPDVADEANKREMEAENHRKLMAEVKALKREAKKHAYRIRK